MTKVKQLVIQALCGLPDEATFDDITDEVAFLRRWALGGQFGGEPERRGANRIDATMGGLGRGAGNCHMELLLGFLRNPKFKLRPIIRLLQDHIEPLKATVEWGPLIPYNITGQMNLHPRAAMQFRASDEKDDYVKFYDQVASDI